MFLDFAKRSLLKADKFWPGEDNLFMINRSFGFLSSRANRCRHAW